ncbi:AAA family ATPase [Archangium violaceum]|uniref:AAA family ATPase n=1 Tax=Archangium violaceum TaxID=83451 RepID=UPI00193B2087|nr:AAA family ATPase [Archangium violaceum]QRK11086.1 AAA family ATPase [Archangium violaceum]
MNKLTKLTIKKFRNVAPTTLEFRSGINVLLGKNAAGKTTLLRLLSAVVGAPEQALKDDALDVSYRIASESIDIEHTVKKTRVEDPALPLDPGRPLKEDLSSLQRTDSFVLEKNGVATVRADVLPNEIVLERADKQTRVESQFPAAPILSLYFALKKDREDSGSKELAEAVLLAQILSAGRMDESLDLFNNLLELEIKIRGSGVRISANRPTIPRSISQMTFESIPESTSATFPLAFLDRASHVLGYDSASARFDIERLSPEPSRQTVRLSNLRFFFKRPGEEVSHDLLSYGQKRLLAFFAHADASRDLIIADELVNGLHHEWISACLDEIGERQAFLTSQNPLLLDFLRFDSVDEVRRTFILCERASGEAGAQLIWRNPTHEEAESFFLAYQTGIQRVSDILLTKGLW